MTATLTPPSATDVRARKFPCDACGADVRWDPGASALRCPYCGASRAVPQSANEILEKPVSSVLRAPKGLGWGVGRKTFQCNGCGARTTFDPGVAAGACAFCGAPAVVETQADANMVRPEGLLPFRVDQATAGEQFRRWIRGLWFRPNDLKHRSEITSVKGVYVPFWTFDAATHSVWTAEAGYYYYVTVQVHENGRTVTRQERRIRWEPANGTLELFFDDVPVPASRGLEASMCEAIEPFPTAELVEYTPEYLSGFGAEEYAVALDEALECAKERMYRDIREACGREVPGDTHRNLEVQTRYSAVAYKNALLPIWISAYNYGGKAFRFLVNGVTGKVSGNAPLSWTKILLAVVALLLVILLLANAI